MIKKKQTKKGKNLAVTGHWAEAGIHSRAVGSKAGLTLKYVSNIEVVVTLRGQHTKLTYSQKMCRKHITFYD